MLEAMDQTEAYAMALMMTRTKGLSMGQLLELLEMFLVLASMIVPETNQFWYLEGLL